MIAVSASGGENDYFVLFRFVSCLLEMTKIFLDDPFLLDDISKQDYDSNGIEWNRMEWNETIYLKIS
jgi:hypothetical protein